MEKNLKIAGVSLIEVMISMVLISLLLIAVASVFPRMSSHRKGIQEADVAKAIASEVLEGLQFYSSMTPEPDPANPNATTCYTLCGADGCDDNPPGYADFYEKWITDGPKPIGATAYEVKWKWDACVANADFNTVDVVVIWRKQGKDHEIKLTGTLQ